MKTFAVLQLTSFAGCEVSMLNADVLAGKDQLAHLPLVI
jgi:hypothetical protein